MSYQFINKFNEVSEISIRDDSPSPDIECCELNNSIFLKKAVFKRGSNINISSRDTQDFSDNVIPNIIKIDSPKFEQKKVLFTVSSPSSEVEVEEERVILVNYKGKK